MSIAEPERRASGAPVHAPRLRLHPARIGRRFPGADVVGRAAAGLLRKQVPGSLHATEAAARGVKLTLQALPDPTLRWLEAGSVGLGAGLILAGAPRVIVAAGVAPALAIAAAVALRPLGPGAAPGAPPRNKDGAT